METNVVSDAQSTNELRKHSRFRDMALVSVGVGLGVAVTFAGTFLIDRFYGEQMIRQIMKKTIPNVSTVAKGFVVPSELEVKVKNVDGEGHNETYCVYRGKKFFFKEDEFGRPQCLDYQ